jgi:hypothetical protein
MPFEIFGIPALICFIIGIFNGIKLMTREETD